MNLAGRWRALALLLVTGTTVSARDALGQDSDLAKWFSGDTGAFVLYDMETDRYVRYDEERCATRFSPCSTFKIPNALIGLDTRVIDSADTVKIWSPTLFDHARPAPPPYDTWMSDHTLRSAMRHSVVWYFQEIARDVGEARYAQYLEALDYGNRDISAGLDRFWLASSLRISADEQVQFLKRMYLGQHPVSARSVSIVKDVLVLEDTPGYRLSGKTGTGPLSSQTYLGWLVGYVERAGHASLFALNVEGRSYASISRERRLEMTKGILRDLGVLPRDTRQ